MKKIAFLVYDYSLTGGAERVVLNLTNELCKTYEVHIISLFNKLEVKKNENIIYHSLVDKTVAIPTHIFSLSSKLRKYVKNNKIEILFAITAGVNSVAYYGLKHIPCKFIYCEHSNILNQTYGKKHFKRQSLGAKKADKVITLTKQDKEAFINKFNIDESRIDYIYNWFEPNINTTIKDKLGKHIISVGRLEKVKGYDNLIKVAKKVFLSHPDWKWDIYGDGTQKDIIQQEIISEGLTNFITLKGNCDLKSIYAKYDIFVMTSYYEGLPVSMLEAIGAHLPVVSFDCPTGPREIIDNNENGYLVDCYDVNKLADAVNSLIDDNDKRNEFSKKADKNLGKFSKPMILQKWIDLIEGKDEK